MSGRRQFTVAGFFTLFFDKHHFTAAVLAAFLFSGIHESISVRLAGARATSLAAQRCTSWLRPDHARFDKPQETERKYNPNQPRVPAGNTGGGQWTSGGTATGATDFSDALRSDDGSPDLIAPFDIPINASDGWSEDREAIPSLQLALLAPLAQATSSSVLLGVEAGLTTFAALLASGNGKSTPALSFRASEFAEPGAAPLSAAVEVARLTREEVDQFCPAHGLVQSLTDQIAISLNRTDYSAQQYGTFVHARMKDEIDNLGNPNLQSEVSYLKTLQETGFDLDRSSQDAYYGQRGSIRIDVLERAGKYVACVYDLKTGDRRLDRPRMQEIATAVLLRFPGTLRIIVIEVRPRR